VPYQPIRVCGTYSATVLAILRPNVVQSKVTPSPSVPDGSLTTTSLALEYQVGQAAAAFPLDALSRCVRPGSAVQYLSGCL
jgi:hypothetical protein